MKMKKMKTFIVGAAALGIIGTGAVSAQAMGLQHISMGSGATVYIQGFNEVGHKGTGAYGTNKNKVVTGVKVTLKEGSFNESANNYAKRGGWTKKLSKVNNPFNTAYTNYSWRY
ncbi:hypothetical protein DN389_07370 [Bacillus sp. AY3-1]|uniref:Lactococcin 972 family bacteriocin n=1 Tax=Bacillus wiedmannii TaxID=1890302 RepID=A0A1C4AAN1_9BACI|nr:MULTISPECIES: hypothetical protein [Bacillus cereus group]KAA0747141.1 hypothetical protein DN389_07370 [Bacillus sp. AY3-1]MCP9280928.1 hypothetical protein [Bacillus wiedmannii]PEP12301.1 hypothetical protein CN552_17865 [Bacillus wiedmannii]PHB02562.1 hypothetical protein COE81_25845 [Bacillus wiedmannii]SCB91672.1 Uncharacterized protein BC05F1_00762 [Bacillus wiedmannii]